MLILLFSPRKDLGIGENGLRKSKRCHPVASSKIGGGTGEGEREGQTRELGKSHKRPQEMELWDGEGAGGAIQARSMEEGAC